MPTVLRKTSAKWLGLENPKDIAISVIEMSGLNSISLAVVMR